MKIKDRGGQVVYVLDGLCQYRSCYWARPDPGIFTQGVGYKARASGSAGWLCGTREAQGCPDTIPEPDPNLARCCHAPDVYLPRKGTNPKRQRCRTCGTLLGGWVLAAVRAGRIEALHRCSHTMAERSVARPGWWECPSWHGGCRGAWDHRPRAHELPMATFNDLYPEEIKQ